MVRETDMAKQETDLGDRDKAIWSETDRHGEKKTRDRDEGMELRDRQIWTEMGNLRETDKARGKKKINTGRKYERENRQTEKDTVRERQTWTERETENDREEKNGGVKPRERQKIPYEQREKEQWRIHKRERDTKGWRQKKDRYGRGI